MMRTRVATLIGTAAVLAVAGAAAANADPNAYSAYLRQHASALARKYGDQALLKEGRKVCNVVVLGASPDDVAAMVQRDLPGATDSDGDQIYSAAGDYLCLDS